MKTKLLKKVRSRNEIEYVTKKIIYHYNKVWYS